MAGSHSDRVPKYWVITGRNWRGAVVEMVAWHLLGVTEGNKKVEFRYWVSQPRFEPASLENRSVAVLL